MYLYAMTAMTDCDQHTVEWIYHMLMLSLIVPPMEMTMCQALPFITLYVALQ